MKRILLIVVILAAFVWWDDISKFIGGNAQYTSGGVKQWMIDHTPKK